MGEKAGKIDTEETTEFYNSLLQSTESVFADITNKRILDLNLLAGKIKVIWNESRNNRRFLLYSLNSSEHSDDDNYLISHSLRSTVIALIIGQYLKLPNHRLVELGMAALLHDIGMLLLPNDSYFYKQDLTEEEKQIIYTHPIHGYKLLTELKCPEPVCLAVLEHHERENGSGYPQNLTGGQISLFAKIIGVACSYEALSAVRKYKKAKDQHTGIIELLKNEDKRYDNKVIKALVDSLSIYPVGMYVLLSDGRQGRVYETNYLNQHCPFVEVWDNVSRYSSDKVKTVIKTSSKGISVVRALAFDEVTEEGI